MPLDLVYEARSTSLRHGALPEFIDQVASGMYPGLHQPEGEVLCVLGTVIGAPETDVLRLTAFRDLSSWETSVALRSLLLGVVGGLMRGRIWASSSIPIRA